MTEGRNVLIALGSPRREGTSALLAAKVAEGAAEKGAWVETVFLEGLRIHGCRACEACHAPGARGCVLEDDMQPLYAKLREAEAIVLASPIYWFNVSAQLKAFIDRWYAFETREGNVLRGKRFAIVLAYGDVDPVRAGATNALRSFEDAFRYLQAEIVGTVYGTALEAGDAARNERLLEQAYQLGKRLLEPR